MTRDEIRERLRGILRRADDRWRGHLATLRPIRRLSAAERRAQRQRDHETVAFIPRRPAR